MATNTQNVNVSGTVGGDVNVNQVVANTISNSLNRVAKSDAPDEMKKRLEELHELVKNLAPKLAPDDQEKAAKNLEVLAREATSKKPDRAWYDVSAKGLMEAASTVADMAAPITKAVQAVLALLI
jgi:hypothetical protein